MEQVLNKTKEEVETTEKEDEELKLEVKKIIEEYKRLGLVEDKLNDKGYLVLSKEELDDWEWDE